MTEGILRFDQLVAGTAGALALALLSLPAHGAYQAPERINLIVGYEAAGGYDISARFIGQFLGDHLPGRPTIVVQNMPGAGSLKAANYLYNAAPRDGTAIGMIGQGIQLMEILGQPGIQFESTKFTWLGRISTVKTQIGVWHTVPAKTIADTKTSEVTIAVGGPLSGSTLYVSFINALYGARLKPVKGYSSREANLAIERGEVDGSSMLVWSDLLSRYPSWISEKKYRILVQIGPERNPELPGVPLMAELGTNEQYRAIFSALASSDIGRSLTAPPNIPAETREALRKGISDALRDPRALAQAKKLNLDLDLAPLEGSKLQAQVQEAGSLPPDLIAKIRRIAAIEK
jgi:tripartite-type tricarboxylate transporter receptor subunit TctC